VIGKTLGPYQVVAKLGVGGMGEVYKARDTRLDRTVAIKVLPADVADDPDLRARFEREARAIAALDHPHICAIYDIGEADQVRFLVMQCLEGDTLAARLSKGPLPLDQVCRYASEIADALDKAHRAGITHRDVKPANIMLTKAGATLLDFGLAKLRGAAAPISMSGMTRMATATPSTAHGTILGTVPYMAPEQVEGKEADARSDIWALGTVIYEMATGTRPFCGETPASVIGAILKDEPAPLSALQPLSPASLDHIVALCLAKDPDERWQSAGDVKRELTWAITGGQGAAQIASGANRRSGYLRRVIPIASVTLLVGIAVVVTWLLTRPSPTADVIRTSVLAPPGTILTPDSAAVAISPDGKMVAFVVGDPQSVTELWVRDLESLTAHRLDGTEGAQLPFWSPDSTRVGFFTRVGAGQKAQLKTVAATGGRVDVICDLRESYGRGASWNGSNVIVFAPGNGPLYRVSAKGGEPTPVTTLDAARAQSGHRFPVFLPDGDHFLYAALPRHADGTFDIFAAALSGGTSTLIGAMESAPVFAEPGWLFYLRKGVLAAQFFDVHALRVTGDPVPLADEPVSILNTEQSFTAGPATSVSPSGALAYFSSPPTNTTATWIDAAGTTLGTVKLPVGPFSGVRISPDGTRAVFVRSNSVTNASLWLVDFAHPGAVLLASGGGRNESPVWSPDGTRVVFASDRDGPQNLFVKNLADASPEEPRYQSPVEFKYPVAWSGDWIVFTAVDPNSSADLWLLPASSPLGDTRPAPYLRTPRKDYLGATSPNGLWMAYVSSDTLGDQLWVQSFPKLGRGQQIATFSVQTHWWSSDSGRLVFMGTDKLLWRADVAPGATLTVSPPTRAGQLPSNLVAVDMMPDGSRFLALIPERTGTGSVTIVHNWRAALEKKR